MKNKFIKYKFISFALLLGAFASCNLDDSGDTAGRRDKSKVTATQTTYSVNEGDTFTVTLNVDKAYNLPMEYKLALVGGTGSNADFTADADESGYEWGAQPGYKIIVPAYATTFSFDVTPIFDLLPEGTETLQLRLSSAGNGNGLVASGSDLINVTVANTTSNDFASEFHWEGSYIGLDDKEHDLCGYDFDLEIYDDAFNVIADSYSDCPEAITVDNADPSFPDGTYYVVPSFWTNAGAATTGTANAPKTAFTFKTKVIMAKPGVWYKEVEFNNVWKSNIGGAAQSNPDAYQVAGVLTKTGTTYVLEDVDGNVLASGRMAQFMNAIKNKKRNK